MKVETANGRLPVSLALMRPCSWKLLKNWRVTMQHHQIVLAPKTLDLFLALVKDAHNWNGMPLFGGNVGGDKSSQGCLMNLKKYGLVKTEQDADNPELSFVVFTDEGKSLAESLGHSIETGKVDAVVKNDVNVGISYYPPGIAEGLSKAEVANAKWAMSKGKQNGSTPAVVEVAEVVAKPVEKKEVVKGKFVGKTIRSLVTENPRREGTHGHISMAIIIKAKEISYEDYRAAGGRPNDLQWDIDHNNVEIV